MDIWEALGIIGQLIAYIFGIVVIVQIVRILVGRSWEVEDAILALMVLNISLSFGIMGYLIKLTSTIYGHIQWHKGRDNDKKGK